MTVINTNTASLTAQYHLSQVNKEMNRPWNVFRRVSA